MVPTRVRDNPPLQETTVSYSIKPFQEDRMETRCAADLMLILPDTERDGRQKVLLNTCNEDN